MVDIRDAATKAKREMDEREAEYLRIHAPWGILARMKDRLGTLVVR